MPPLWRGSVQCTASHIMQHSLCRMPFLHLLYLL
jgi:hypothetical protein